MAAVRFGDSEVLHSDAGSSPGSAIHSCVYSEVNMDTQDIQRELMNAGFAPDAFNVGYKGGYRGSLLNRVGFVYCDPYCNVVLAHDRAEGIAIEVFCTVGKDGQQLDHPEGCIVQLEDSATRYALAMYLLQSLRVSDIS